MALEARGTIQLQLDVSTHCISEQGLMPLYMPAFVWCRNLLCCGCTSRFYRRWAWSRGRKKRKEAEAEPADSEFPKSSRAANLGPVTAAGWISPPSRMAPAREEQVRGQEHLDLLLSSAHISVYDLVSQCLSFPSVNSSFENLFLQPHLEISVLSHFIETLYIF